MLKLIEQSKVAYQIKQNSVLFLKNVNLVQNETMQIWEYSVKKQDTDNWKLTLKFTDVQSKNNSDTQQVVDFSKMLNQPFNELSLLLDYTGAIVQILNKKEILNKWEKLKKELERHTETNPELKKVIKQCDIDFRFPLERIKKSLLYFLFLSPVYCGQGNNIAREFSFPSVINSGENLLNSVRQKLVKLNDNECVFNLACEHTNYGYQNLEKRYQKELSKFLATPLNYLFKFDATNAYDNSTGLLNSSVAKLREEANAEFYYDNSVSIELKERV